MYISELEVNNFGKFNEKKINFTSGVNVVYGENESGKSTLFAFIKSMFFGIDRQRGLASKKDEYSLYEPWINRTYYEGKLRFVAGERKFRIERGFNKVNKFAYLFNEDDGEELDIEQGDLHNILDGMTENIFMSANALAQSNSKGIEGLKSEFRNYTSNCRNIYDNPINVDGAIESLKRQKREYEYKLKDEKNKTNQLLARLEGEYKFLSSDIQKKQNQIDENAKKLDSRKKDIFRQISNKAVISVKHIIVIVTMIFAFLVLGICLNKTLVLGSVGIILGFVKIFYNIINKKIMVNNVENIYDEDVEIRYLCDMIKDLKADLGEDIREVENVKNEIEKMSMNSEREIALTKEIEAIEFAIEKIKETVLMIQNDTVDILNRNVSKIYSKITNGKYSDVKIDTEFNSMLNTKDKLISSTKISKGARDELDFAVRLAVSDMFFADEKMPIIIDDMFVMYDDKRISSTLDILAKMNTQVIIFTCHRREREVLESKGIKHKFIELTT